jgi:hypothetical protein
VLGGLQAKDLLFAYPQLKSTLAPVAERRPAPKQTTKEATDLQKTLQTHRHKVLSSRGDGCVSLYYHCPLIETPPNTYMEMTYISDITVVAQELDC